MESSSAVIIMAAGNDERMKSDLPKLLHQVCGRSMIDYIVHAALQVSDSAPIVVTGPGSSEIRAHLGQTCRYVFQEEQLGTGHAVMTAVQHLPDSADYIVVLPGDVPLILGSTLKKLVQYAKDSGFDAVVLTAAADNPDGCGSVYCFKSQSLQDALTKLESCNAQNEYCMTDVMSILKSEGRKTGALTADDPNEALNVNDRISLAQAESLMRRRINEYHMKNGVTIIDPSATYIGPEVKIGQDTVVYPGNVLEGATVIGRDCILYPNNRLVNAVVDCRVKLQSSVVMDSHIGCDTTVGPYAYIRPDCKIGDHVRIGDFVEVKNSSIGSGTKVSHLTYIGDAQLGEGINVGCGVVCVNYDGRKKHKTVVGDNAFIGCNVNLVAPVEVENNAYIAAGSTITEKVPSGALAIARARQVNKEGWVNRREQKKTEEKS